MISSQSEEKMYIGIEIYNTYMQEKRNNTWKYGRNSYRGESNEIIETNRRQKHSRYI